VPIAAGTSIKGPPMLVARCHCKVPSAKPEEGVKLNTALPEIQIVAGVEETTADAGCTV